MTHGPRIIRKRVFLGCQGDSERSYGTFLHRLIETKGRLHIDAVPLQPGAGDPLATVERAVRMLKKRESTFGAYAVRAILLDYDQWGLAKDRDCQVMPLAKRHRIHLIWQNPTHEALLLRHITGRESHKPQTAKEALRRLRAKWNDYEKGIPANYLSGKLTVVEVQRACTAEPDLCTFLDGLGYFKP